MAFWVVGGGSSFVGSGGGGGDVFSTSRSPPVAAGGRRRFTDDLSPTKRRVYGPDSGLSSPLRGITKRPRLDDWGRVVGHHGGDDAAPSRGSIHVKNLAFLVIHEREPSPPRAEYHPPFPPVVTSVERTQSGLSISSDASAVQSDAALPLLSDQAAAALVRRHVSSIRHRHRDSQHGRILASLINPKSRGADFPLDNDALRSIFSAANELFFANRLARRVAWDWSHPASEQYESRIVGTTALRRSARLGGYETLIVLSSPILRDDKYNRRLLISTFLHEMIHSFLFIMCGFEARQCGGHTLGFRQIAEVIDEWVGKEVLRLRDMEADLERFIEDPMPHLNSGLDPWGGPSRVTDPQRGYPGEWEWHDREGFRAPRII